MPDMENSERSACFFFLFLSFTVLVSVPYTLSGLITLIETNCIMFPNLREAEEKCFVILIST